MKQKRIISLILTLILLVSLVPTAFAEKNGEITGTFSYIGQDGKTDYEQSFTYSDDYFTKSAYVYRQDLARLSISFAHCCGIAGNNYAIQADNTKAMMDKCGFKGFKANEDFLKRPEANTMGVSCAYKTISDNSGEYTLIAVLCRGFNYFREWAGNAYVGESGDHKGFAIATDTAINFLKQYIADAGIKGRIKIWMTGYSRGGVVANMAGGMLDNGYDLGKNVSLSRHDLYVYCFEPPMGVDASKDTSSRIYENINNIVNPCDLVQYVAPEFMGFTRYGVDRVIPKIGDAEYNTLRNKMVEYLSTEPGAAAYDVDKFQYIGIDLNSANIINTGKKMTLPEFYPLLLDALRRDVCPDRAYFVAHDQETLMELCGTIFGIVETQGADLGEVIPHFAKLVSENAPKLLSSIAISGKSENGLLVQQLTDLMLKALKDSDIVLNEHDTQDLTRLAVGLADIITKLAVNDPDVLATAIFNLTKLIACHYPEVTRAWMMTLPDDYMTGKAPAPTYAWMYSDVSGSEWFAPYAEYVTLGNLMNGTGNNCFSPKDTTSRAMLATILYRLEGEPSVAGKKCPFTDVKSGWYKNAVIWAYNAGIVNGTSASKFSPNSAVTREQMVAMLYRYTSMHDKLQSSTAAKAFKDYSSVSKYAVKPMNWAVAEGIINGRTPATLVPGGTSTRAEIAAVICRFCEA